jgi:inosine/xanthosine triphosphatase
MASEKMLVAIGSTNPVKFSATKAAFERAFSAECAAGVLDFKGVSAASGVSDQPMGDDETRKGATNRAVNAARNFYKSEACWPDFALGLEGGCEDREEETPIFDSKSFEAGTAAVPPTVVRTKELSCFAWIAILEVKTGKWGFARTGTFKLPPAVSELVRSGVELGVADDRVFGRSNSKEKDGAVGLLTKGLIDRAAYYEHATTLALIPFISKEHY